MMSRTAFLEKLCKLAGGTPIGGFVTMDGGVRVVSTRGYVYEIHSAWNRASAWHGVLEYRHIVVRINPDGTYWEYVDYTTSEEPPPRFYREATEGFVAWMSDPAMQERAA